MVPGTRTQGCCLGSSGSISLPHRFVSDYAFAGYKPVCQRKLMHAMARSQLGAAAARTFPPSLLEWTANRQQASMALDLHCFNGTGLGRVSPLATLSLLHTGW